MIYSTCLMVYASFAHSRSGRFKLSLAIFLIALAIFITLYYHYLQDPRFHQTTYALLTTIVLFRSMFIMETTMRPMFRRGEPSTVAREKQAFTLAARQSDDVRDVQILSEMWILLVYGLSIFLGGFAIWTLDNVYCSKLRKWRRDLGLPWGILLEGHGWW